MQMARSVVLKVLHTMCRRHGLLSQAAIAGVVGLDSGNVAGGLSGSRSIADSSLEGLATAVGLDLKINGEDYYLNLADEKIVRLRGSGGNDALQLFLVLSVIGVKVRRAVAMVTAAGALVVVFHARGAVVLDIQAEGDSFSFEQFAVLAHQHLKAKLDEFVFTNNQAGMIRVGLTSLSEMRHLVGLASAEDEYSSSAWMSMFECMRQKDISPREVTHLLKQEAGK